MKTNAKKRLKSSMKELKSNMNESAEMRAAKTEEALGGRAAMRTVVNNTRVSVCRDLTDILRDMKSKKPIHRMRRMEQSYRLARAHARLVYIDMIETKLEVLSS